MTYPTQWHPLPHRFGPGDARPVLPKARQARPTLTVVLPCYNEAERLPRTLRSLLAHLSGAPGEVEVLVVDDGSTDATVAAVAAIAAADVRVRLLCLSPNRGKGAAVRAGMLAAEGELIVFTDADGSYGPSELDRIIRALAEAPVAIGARVTTRGPLTRRVASRVFSLAIRVLVGLPFRDTQSGLKGFRRAAAREVFSRARLDGFAFDVEALLLAGRLGLDVVEVGVQAIERRGSKVRVLADAPRMLGEVWAVRRAVATAPTAASSNTRSESLGPSASSTVRGPASPRPEHRSPASVKPDDEAIGSAALQLALDAPLQGDASPSMARPGSRSPRNSPWRSRRTGTARSSVTSAPRSSSSSAPGFAASSRRLAGGPGSGTRSSSGSTRFPTSARCD